MTGGVPLLRIEELSVQFATARGPVRALDGVSLSIDQGQTIALLGDSGSGKSVTGFSILRLIPDPPGRIVGGRILFDGDDLLCLAERRMRRIRGNDVAMIFQEPMTALNPVYPIGEQIAEVIRLHQRVDRRQARRRSAEMLDLVGIPDAGRRRSDYPHQLSGDMRQRAMIAIALACRPRLLIADEPTTALDVTVQAQVLDLIGTIQRETGMAVLFITHDVAVAAEIADRITVMYAGRVVEEAATEALIDAPRMPYTAGLLGSVPDPGRRRRLMAIPGSVPDSADPPAGCSFHPRCDYAQPRCRAAAPDLETVAEDHRARCHRWRDIDLAPIREAVA